jgi:hypothetical protein
MIEADREVKFLRKMPTEKPIKANHSKGGDAKPLVLEVLRIAGLLKLFRNIHTKGYGNLGG